LWLEHPDIGGHEREAEGSQKPGFKQHAEEGGEEEEVVVGRDNEDS
jgi:hypothetical protein